MNFKKIIIIMTIAVTALFANVKATVSKSEVVRGNEVTLNLTANGENIKFPNINLIGGFNISSTETSQSISIVNGQTSKTVTNSYTFTPLDSITIPSYKIIVGKKAEYTNPIKIKVVKSPINGKNADFTLRMITNKSSAYVGEPVVLKIIFKQKRSAQVKSIEFKSPNFPNFWVQTDGKDKKEIVGDYVIHNLSYMLIPQQSGTIKIPAVKVSIAKIVETRDPFAFMLQRLRWKNIYSNELSLKVKPLPNGISEYGDFHISDRVDKTNTKANEPVNLTLSISGSGNIDNIDSFDLKIPGATIYKDKPIRNSFLQKGEYKGKFTQKFAIIANKSYVIPSIKFSFFDKLTNSVKTIQTKSIKINVTGTPSLVSHNIVQSGVNKTITKEKIVYKNKNPFEKWIYFIIGLFVGIVIMIFPKIFNFNKEQSEHPLSYNIKHAKDDKELLKILLPLVDKSKEIKDIVTKLEENIYMNKDNKIDKKGLAKNITFLLNPKNDELI